MSWCPICGPEVATDEDGCCVSCGATAQGTGASEALRLREENAALRAMLASARREASKQCDAATASEAKLAKVVETLEYLRKANDPHDCPRNWCECCFIESALAAAKGE